MLTIARLLDPLLQQRLKIIWMYLWKALHAGMTCCYGRDTLRLNIGIPEPKGAQVTILQSIDNPRLISLIEHYIQNYGA